MLLKCSMETILFKFHIKPSHKIPHNMIEDLVHLLDKEINSYTSSFDTAIQERYVTKQSDAKESELDFHTKLQKEQQDFNVSYVDKLSKLKSHVSSEVLKIDRFERESVLKTLHNIETEKNKVVQSCLNKIFNIRVEMDKYDDFLSSSKLEVKSDLHSFMSNLQDILHTDTRDYEFLSEMYKALNENAVPPSSLNDLVVSLIPVANNLPFMNMKKKEHAISIESGNTNSRNINPEWELISNLFSVYPLNDRLLDKKVYTEFPLISLKFITLVHVLNKYRHRIEYKACEVSENRTFVHHGIIHKDDLDPELAKVHYNTTEGLRTAFLRTSLALMLEKTVSGGYKCKIPNNIKTVHDNHHNINGTVLFDSDMNVTDIVLDSKDQDIKDSYVCTRVISHFHTYLQWSCHLGLCHTIISDEWLYMLKKHVKTEHPLNKLLDNIRDGVDGAVDVAGLVLVNGMSTNIACVISDISPVALRSMVFMNHDNFERFFHMNQLNMSLPDGAMKRTLNRWWTIFEHLAFKYEKFKDDASVVKWLESIHNNSHSLTETITMMFFNMVIHELFSNIQMLNDAVENKVFSCVRTDGLNPCSYIHQRYIETLVATSGNSLRFDDNYDANGLLSECLTEIRELSVDMDSDKSGVKFLKLLHPKNIERSIRW